MDEVQEITGIITQGNPREDEWVTKYKIMYGDDGKQWKPIQNGEGYDMVSGHVVIFKTLDSK